MKTPTENQQQELYIRARENPYFKDIRKVDQTFMARAPTFSLKGSANSQSIAESSLDIDEDPKSSLLDISESIVEESPENIADDSISDIVLETSGQSLPGRQSLFGQVQTFAFPIVSSDISIDLEQANDFVKESVPTVYESVEGFVISQTVGRPTFERSYTLSKRKLDLSKIPLPQTAALFYDGNASRMEIMESSDGINRLNLYLRARRDDIDAGIPGRFLHAVIGQDISDVGSVASTIMYAFYLNETSKSSQLCTVPVVNMRRADLSSHLELKWLLESCHIDEMSLIFIDEIDLSYYDQFGSLKLVLLNGNRVPAKQEALKEALIEIFNCKKGNSAYPWVDTVTVGQDCSCCTLIAEKFASASPEDLAGQGFSRILLAGILLDTGNLTSPLCTSKDKYMATLLINGAGRFGCNGFYQILKYKMYDISELKVGDILRKDFKKWTRVGRPDVADSKLMVSHIGMSSIGISVGQLLSHEYSSTREIIHFQQSEKLRILMIVSGYYDGQKNFKREILICAESVELMKNLLHFLNSSASQLPLKVLHQPGLQGEIRAFEIDKVTSRKTIEHLLEEFSRASKR